MKVVRLHFLLFENKRINPTGLDGNHVVLVLQRARNDEERAVHDYGVFFLEKRWSIDDVGDAGFIFKTQDKSLLSECATGTYHLLLSDSLGLFPPPRPFDIGSWPTCRHTSPGIRKT